MKKIAGVFVLGLLAFTCIAQSPESLKERIQEHYNAINSNNLDEVLSHHLEEFSLFPWNGTALLEPGFSKTQAKMGADIPFPGTNLAMKHFNAQIFENVGVAMFYLYGSYGDKTGTWRVTAIWVWQDGEWKEAHHHESPLRS